jgi:hypothetical protein
MVEPEKIEEAIATVMELIADIPEAIIEPVKIQKGLRKGKNANG